jgi:hypothetical protein
MGGFIKNLEDAVKGVTLAAILGTSMFSSASETPAFAQQQNKLQEPKKVQEAKRDEVPDEDTQSFREDQIKKSFSEDYKKKDIASKLVLADKLFKSSEDPKNDPVLRFCLIREGMRAAAEGLDLDKAFGFVDRLSESYRTTGLGFKCESFNIAKKLVTNAEQATSVGGAGYDLATMIYVKSDVNSAIKIASDAKGLPKLPKDALPKFTDLISEMTQVSNAETALFANTNDAKSNNIIGRYTAFRKGKWDDAKDVMKKGNDEDLKLIIDLELANPDNIESQYGLAVKYFDSSKKLKGFEKDQYVQRGLYWCNEAIPKANALMKADIEKKMKEFGGSSTKGNLVDLLKMIDPAKDAVSGKWKLEGGKLISEKVAFAKIEIPYEPPEEYDLRVVFSRQQGNLDVVFCLSRSEKPFHWQMAAADGTYFGFSITKTDSSNPSVKKSKLVNNKKYTALIQVRKDNVKAYLDNELMSEWKSEYGELGSNSGWKLRNEKSLGFGSNDNDLIFYNAEVVEKKGKGKITK